MTAQAIEPVTQPSHEAAVRRNRFNRNLTRGAAYFWLIIVAITTTFPFFWMVSTSLKPKPEIYYYRLLPIQPTLAHYIDVLTRWQFGTWFFNSIIVTVLTTFSVLFFCSLAGYALAKFNFPGRNIFFVIILATIMVPGEMLLIPWYVGAFNLKITNSLMGVMFPGLIGAFGVFVMRQAFLNLPGELLDAARVDGMSELGIFFKIALPLTSGALAALGVLTALGVWNDYFWPLIILQSLDRYTIQLGMVHAAATDAAHDYQVDWTVIMSTTTIAALPMLVLIALLQKYFVRGIAMTGLKG